MMVQSIDADLTVSAMLHLFSPVSIASWTIEASILIVLLLRNSWKVPDPGIEELSEEVGQIQGCHARGIDDGEFSDVLIRHWLRSLSPLPKEQENNNQKQSVHDHDAAQAQVPTFVYQKQRWTLSRIAKWFIEFQIVKEFFITHIVVLNGRSIRILLLDIRSLRVRRDFLIPVLWLKIAHWFNFKIIITSSQI